MQVKYRNFVFYSLFFFIEICWNCFVSSKISSNVITKSSIIKLPKYFPFSFSQLDIAELYNLFYIYDVFCTRIYIYHYSTFDLKYTFYHQIYIYIRMIYLLSMHLLSMYPLSMYISYASTQHTFQPKLKKTPTPSLTPLTKKIYYTS